jgi:hypothetical protein
MKKHRLKNYLRLGILLFGISVFVIACQQDDFESNEDVQVLIPKGKSYAKINTGNNVSESAVDFLKEKTNNTLGVIIGTDNVRLSINDVAYRTSPLGTVDTSKEVVVINETNTKHTFKVDNPNDTSNNVTNIIVVENENETFEYFLKYTFDGGIPYNANGTVDLSRFTGTIDAYDSDGQRTGGISISNGEVTGNDGQTTPCPDDTTTPPDDDDDNNQTGGGAQGEVGDGSPDNGNTGGTDNDQGGGGWFDGGPDWNPCTLSYHRECSNGYSGEHEPTAINTAGDLCSGTLNGAGVLVVTDCNGTVLGSGRYMNRTDGDETLNPCGGTTGVILEDKHEKNCEELNTLSNDAEFLGIMTDLNTKSTTVNKEVGYIQKEDTTTNSSYAYDYYEESDVDDQINIDILFGTTLKGFFHTHDDLEKHLPVFSLDDLYAAFSLFNPTFNADGTCVFNNSFNIEEDFTMVLITAHGTKLALKFDSNGREKLRQFGEKYFGDWNMDLSALINMGLEPDTDRKRVTKLFERTVKKSFDIEKQKKQFAKFLDDEDFGMSLYQATGDTFTEWEKVNKNGTTTPCNN